MIVSEKIANDRRRRPGRLRPTETRRPTGLAAELDWPQDAPRPSDCRDLYLRERAELENFKKRIATRPGRSGALRRERI